MREDVRPVLAASCALKCVSPLDQTLGGVFEEESCLSGSLVVFKSVDMERKPISPHVAVESSQNRPAAERSAIAVTESKQVYHSRSPMPFAVHTRNYLGSYGRSLVLE